MNFRTTYILFGVLVALFAVVALVLVMGPSAPKVADALFPSATNKATKLDPDDFTRVIIKRLNPADEEIVLEKGDDKVWRITTPRPLPADTGSVSGLLQNITSARVDKDVKPRNKKEAGLDQPSRVLVFVAKDGRELKLTLGDTTPLENDALVFAESSDRPGELLAVKKADIRSALEPFAYFRGKDLLGDTADINGIKLSMGKREPVELKKDKGGWRYVTPAYGEADASGLISALTGLTVSHIDEKTSDFVKDGVPPEDWAKYNLDPAKGDVLRVEVTREKGKPSAAYIGVSKKDGDRFFAAAEGQDKTRDVVKVSATGVETLTKLIDDPSTLRNKNLVRLENVTPDAIDVQNNYGLLEFRKPPRAFDWELYRDGKPHKVDDGEMRLLIDSINKKDQVVSFPDPKRRKELGLEKPDFIVKIWADSLEKPEDKKDDKDDKKDGKKDDKKDEKKDAKPAFKKGAEPVAELRFGNVEGGNVAVERIWGKQSDIVMVPVLLRDNVRKRPLDYYDKSLPKFNELSAEENVTKLEITRGGETAELSREKGAGPFTFVKPAAYKGRKASDNAVRDILDSLNRITAKEIAAEKADAKELAGTYGLEPAAIKATVTVTKDGKATTHTFDLGKSTMKGVYARLGGNPAVYVVDASLAEGLKKELRDTTVLDFDTDKVTNVTIQGWKGVLGRVETLSADKAMGKWTVKSPAGYTLDQEKLDSFLSRLSKLHAEKFIASGKNLKPEEKGFQVTITLADKSVLTLNVGDEEGGGLAATSSQMKGEFFTVPKDAFTEAMKLPAYFAK